MCVRLVQMKGVDLTQFQFDYDLTWAVVFVHADGTVLARYGSRTKAGPMATNSMAGLKSTMTRVLEAHREYPGNRVLFAEKRGPKPKYRRPELIPSKHTRRPQAASKENCMHCHNVYDAYHDLQLRSGTYDPRKVWKYPLPENVGLVVDPVSGNHVNKILPESPAARAGLRGGDVIETLGGQAILSLADIQFALHFLTGDTNEVPLVVRRGDKTVATTLRLAGPWREGNLSWRVSMYGMPPSPGLWVEDLADEKSRDLGLSDKKLALLVRGAFGGAVRRAGVRKNDVIVSYDGKSDRVSPGEFHVHLRLNHHESGSVLELEVLREGRKRRIDVKF